MVEGTRFLYPPTTLICEVDNSIFLLKKKPFFKTFSFKSENAILDETKHKCILSTWGLSLDDSDGNNAIKFKCVVTHDVENHSTLSEDEFIQICMDSFDLMRGWFENAMDLMECKYKFEDIQGTTEQEMIRFYHLHVQQGWQ